MTERDGFRLCYVDAPWAYFANVEPTEMWGDDWCDAPHDCNAGTPYIRDGQAIVTVAFEADLEVVGTDNRERWGYLSVEQINRGDAPWLIQPDYGRGHPMPKREIHAGITLGNFKLIVGEIGGKIYEAQEKNPRGDRMKNLPTLTPSHELPDEPDTWGELLPSGYRQRWMPGAFGERVTLAGVLRFVVQEDHWREDEDGIFWRTITKGSDA